MKNKIENVLCGVSILLLIWIVLSYINIINHNITDYEYSKYNVFVWLVDYLADDTETEVIELEENHHSLKGPKLAVTHTTTNETQKEILAHVINGEAGSDWCSDKMMMYVGSVALNRVNHPSFPNTLEKVVFQKGQYACTWDGNYYKKPCDRAYRIAEELLINGSVLPEEVVFQAQFRQGSGVYEKVQNMYFCY